MSQHTKGQLHTGGNGTIIYDRQGWGVASATVYHARQEPQTSEANARRLAACWNACEGVSTERLEGDFAQGYEPWSHVQHLQAQRDQLLAALAKISANAGESTEWIRRVADEATAQLPKPLRYTSSSKGGSYEKLSIIRGAGRLKGFAGIAYRDTTTGELFVREPECFAARMKPIEGGAA